MVENVEARADIITDSYNSYNSLSKSFEHTKIKHTEGNYITTGDRTYKFYRGFLVAT
ncbi:MAG: hypothetical protein EOO90_03750 [Pedobacter sp.]|nr:MAG: hypothetical protein EOO90_03750 [Pedobacter sp.]